MTQIPRLAFLRPALPRLAFLRRAGLVALALALPLVSGCGLAQITIGYDIAEQRVPGSPLGGLLGATLLDTPIDVDLAAETAARDTGPAQHVYLESFSLAVTATAEPAGDTDDLGFISRVDVFIEGRAGSSLPRVRIAYLDQVPEGARTLSFDLERRDLIEYFRQGARITANATGNAPDDDVTYDGHLDFSIEVL